jgi:thioredoxin reductase (NADPH)
MEFNLSGLRAGNTNSAPQATKVLILGSGPAGLAAALYAARAELDPIVLTGTELGGQAGLTNVIENYPGFPEGVGGPQLGELFQKQAERFGARVDFATVTAVDLAQRPFRVTSDNGEYLAETLVVATGATPNHLNIPGEVELTGRGTSYCATCDGWFFKERRVVVVGGGDSALEEALFLTRFASSVTIVHRRETFRASQILQRRARENSKINFVLESVVEEILGSEKVEGVVLRHVKTGEKMIFPTDGVFIFIGHTPNSQIFQGQLRMDDRGYVLTDALMQTNVPGVYAAGEIADPNFRQVITSAGMGAAAAIRATHFLEDEEKNTENSVPFSLT